MMILILPLTIISILLLHAPCMYRSLLIVVGPPRRAMIITSHYTVNRLSAMLDTAHAHEEMKHSEDFCIDAFAQRF